MIVMKKIIMSSIDKFRAPREAEPAAARRETAIHNPPYDARTAMWSSFENAAAPSEIRGGAIPEEIKRRQVSLALRYVLAVRARYK